MTKNIQKLIERAKQEWEATVDALPQLICLFDQHGHILRANMTVEHWNLAPVIEVKGRTLHELFHPHCADGACHLMAFLQQAWQDLTRNKVVNHEIYDDRLQRHLHFQMQPVLISGKPNDQASFAVAIIEDITERKQVEERLKLSQFSIDRAVESIFWIGPDGRFLYVNDTACQFLGYTRAELLTLTMGDIDSRYPTEIWPIHWKATKERGPITVESRHLTNSGEKVPVEVTFNHLEFEGKEYCCTFARDISWRIWSAEALRDSEEALRQSNTELQTRNEDLDAFAHTVAHDLKNPLNIIVGYAETMDAIMRSDDPLLAKKGVEAAQIIAQTGRKMDRIINELLLLAEMRETKITFEPLTMTDIVDQALLRLIHMMEDYQAEISRPATWPVANGYGPWVEEVWVNYLSNALKYGGQPPRIQLGATPQPDGMIKFWIEDNGPGINPEKQSQLFTPFTRLDPLHVQGHGLGLSIVRRIVDKLNGQVGVESAPEQGSLFFFTLPNAAS